MKPKFLKRYLEEDSNDTKLKIYNDVKALAVDWGKHTNEAYFFLEPMSIADLEPYVREVKSRKG